jgi:hypothetical protein
VKNHKIAISTATKAKEKSRGTQKVAQICNTQNFGFSFIYLTRFKNNLILLNAISFSNQAEHPLLAIN